MEILNGHKANRTPSYYIRKRLFNNIPAVVGMLFIALATIVALLGYHIMPDNTRMANDGAVQVQKMEPLSRVTVIKIRKNIVIEEQSLFDKLFSGRETEFSILPVKSYKIVGDQIEVEEYKATTISKKDVSKRLDTKKLSLLNVVKSTRPGEIHGDGNSNFNDADIIDYTDVSGKRTSISLGELKKEFLANHIEERTFYLGTDKAGRDILSQLILGTRVSLAIGLIAVLISILVGVTMGSMAGFFGGFTDKAIMWLMTVVWSIPGVMLVIAISLALNSKGIWVAFVAVGLTMWVDVARVVRGEILGIKEKSFIESAHALGFKNSRIIFNHILPNILGSLIVIASANFASAIMLEAGLSFLGLGVQPPMPSWGMMVHEGYTIIGTNSGWGLVLYPGLCIMIMVLSFNLFGNGLRDAYDPKTQI